MKIVIDARLYGPKQGGLGRYLEQLILNLEKIDTTNQYVILLRRDNWNEYTPSNKNFEKNLADIPWYGLSEQILLPLIIKKTKPDLVHFPHWNVPLFFRGNFVVTIHDLLLLHYPTKKASTLGPITYLIKNKIFRLVLNHAAKASKKIITISEFSRQDIVKTLNIKPEKIVVTKLAPHKIEARNTAAKPEILKKYQITKPFWLYVGVAYPHKNLETLLAAWEIFQKKYSFNYQLVLVGKKNYFYERLEKIILAKNISDIILTDFLPDADLSALYQKASLYVFPSCYEGFGLPPLEAISYGVPVICANTTALPEILEDAALFFNPNLPAAIADQANMVLTDPKLAEEILSNGQKILQKYDFKTTAQKTLEVYQNLLKKVDN